MKNLKSFQNSGEIHLHFHFRILSVNLGVPSVRHKIVHLMLSKILLIKNQVQNLVK